MLQATRTQHQTLQVIWRAVRAIPRGRVCTYGAVARLAGQVLEQRRRLRSEGVQLVRDRTVRDAAPNLGELLWRRS